jgi:spore coat protein SA
MKTLMIATEKLPVPPIRGGAIQTYIANVAPRLAQSGVDLTVLGVSDPELPAQERRDGVRYVRVEGGTLDRYQAGVTAFLAAERFDRIHLFNRPKLVLPVAAAAPGTPLSLSLHNEMFLPRKIDPTEAQAAIAAVDRIATVSNFIGKGISDLYPEAGPKLRTIYSGVDAGQFVPGWTSNGRAMRDTLRQAHGLKGRQVVLFVGRLSPKKGADVLLRAMERVAKEVPGVALVLVGSKWYGANEITDYVAYLQNLAARSPVPVVVTGFITPDQVNQWFAVGDLFVCPSVWQEPLARVHYEAMAAGLPIITTRRGGNPEVVDGTGVGLVVDQPESPEAMAQAILQLLKSPSKREGMGQAGRRLALERFNWDRVASEIGALWAGAAEEARLAAEVAPVAAPVAEPDAEPAPAPAVGQAPEPAPAVGQAPAPAGGSGEKKPKKKRSSDEKKSRAEQPPAAEQKPRAEARPDPEQKPPVEQRTSAEQKPRAEKEPSAEQKPRSEQRSGAEQKPNTEQRTSLAKKSSVEQRTSKEQKASPVDGAKPRVDRIPASDVELILDPVPSRSGKPSASAVPGRSTAEIARRERPSGHPGNYTAQSITISVRARAKPPTRPNAPSRPW